MVENQHVLKLLQLMEQLNFDSMHLCHAITRWILLVTHDLLTFYAVRVRLLLADEVSLGLLTLRLKTFLSYLL